MSRIGGAMLRDLLAPLLNAGKEVDGPGNAVLRT